MLEKKMQESYLDETRVIFYGDLWILADSKKESQDHNGSTCLQFSTGENPNLISALLYSFCRRISGLPINHPLRLRARRISDIYFSHYSFQEFPPANIRDSVQDIFEYQIACTIDHCPNLTSLGTIISEFPNVHVLTIKRCPMLTSVAFLVHCANLNILRIQKCGISVVFSQLENESTSWDSILKTFSERKNDNVFELAIHDCPEMNMIPPSIQFLRNCLVTLSLDRLPKFKYIPSEIGDLQSLVLFTVTNTAIQTLPSEIGRLNDCSLFIQGEILTCPPKCHRGSIRSMRNFFTRKRLKAFKGFVRLAILFRHAKLRAIERLFCPGGNGYKRCRDNFLLMSTNAKRSR